MSEGWSEVFKLLVIFAGIGFIGMLIVQHEEIYEWFRYKLKRGRPEADLGDWHRAEVKIALDFASNGVVIRAFSRTKYSDLEPALHTRIATDMSEVGKQVMTLLAEIELKK